MSLLKKIFQKNTTNTGIKNINKIEHNGKIHYQYKIKHKDHLQIRSMSDLDFFIKSLERDGVPIIIEDDDLFKESILESRKDRYYEHCEILGVVADKDPNSFCQPYSEWPVPDGRWSIIRFDGSERFTIQRKDKESVLELVDDLNNGREYPYKIIKNDYSRKYGVGMELK